MAKKRPALGSPGARKRPPTLIYSVDEVPPWPLRLTLAFQHVLAMSVGWVYVLVAALSGYIVRQYSDRVNVKRDGDTCTVLLHFEH